MSLETFVDVAGGCGVTSNTAGFQRSWDNFVIEY